MEDLPIIGLFFANSDNQLANLQTEWAVVSNVFDRLHKINKTCRSESIYGVTIDSLINKLKYYGNDMVIFHYGGHANGIKLEFQDTSGRTIILGQLLNQQAPNLKVIFINGCNSRGQAEHFFKYHESVEAVIATNTFISDSKAPIFARDFYENLGNGKSIEAAFLSSMSRFSMGIENEESELEKFIITRGFSFEEEESFEFEWELLLKENIARNWTIESYRKSLGLENFSQDDIAQLQVLKNEIKVEKNKIKAQETYLAQNSSIPDLVKNSIVAAINKSKKLIISNLDKIKLIKTKYTQTKREQDFKAKKKIQQYLKALNFTEQDDYLFDNILDKSAVSYAAVIHGGKDSGLYTYQERLLEKVGIQNDDKKVHFNFAKKTGHRPTIDNIWQKVAVEFKLNKDTTPQEITNYILNNFCVSEFPRNAVIIFDRVDEFENDIEDVIDIFDIFWITLQEHINIYFQDNNITSLTKNIILLVLDHKYSIEGDNYKLADHKNMEYKILLKEIESNYNDSIHIFPHIKKITLFDLKKWRQSYSTPTTLNSYQINKSFFNDILGQNNLQGIFFKKVKDAILFKLGLIE